MKQGEEKTGVTAHKVELLKAAMPDTHRGQLEVVKVESQQQWATFVENLQQTK